MAGSEVLAKHWDGRLDALQKSLQEEPGGREWAEHAESLLNVFSETLMDVTVLPVVRNYRSGQASGSVSYYHQFLDRCLQMLAEGHVIAVYPEGTRSKDGRMQRFKGFAARMALQARVPVVPAALCGIFGLSDVQRWAEGKNRGRSVIYRIGPPITPEEFPPGTDKRSIKELTRRMEDGVAELLGRSSVRA